MCRFGVLLFVWSVGVLSVEFEVCGVFVCSVQRQKQRQRDQDLHLGSHCVRFTAIYTIVYPLFFSMAMP